MIENMDCVISYRSTAYFGADKYYHSNKDVKPIVLIAYDSRIHGMVQIKTMLPYVETASLTPEGLCFEAIMKSFIPINNDMDSYFLNLSDGQPYFGGRGFYYSGDAAEKHTGKMVKMIESMGIKTLSYFISDYDAGSYDRRSFKTMYGNGAKFVDVTNLNQITKTMNQLFLQK